MIETDEFLTVEDVATWWKTSKEWVYDAVAAETIPCHRIGRQLRFRRRDLEDYLKSVETTPAKPSVE